MALGLGLSCACTKEAPQKKAQERAVNPYSAESVFEEVQTQLKKNPNDTDALYHLADLYDRNSQYAEAIDTYKKVVALKPDMGYAYIKMGTAYDRLNKPAEAIAAFRTAERHLPKYPVLYNNMGIAYGRLGSYDNEIAALRKAISLRPTYSTARYNLGMAYLRKHDRQAALKEYEKLKEFDEGTAESLRKEIDHGK